MVYHVTRKRGRINKVGEAHCEIFSVDTGQHGLMHVRPFKQHGYRWSDEAKRYFNRTASVSYVSEAFVGDRLPEETSYEIVLNIVMKRHDICVNGSMVKEGFAESSGSESAVVERIKEVILEDDGEGVILRVETTEHKSVEEAGTRTLGSRIGNVVDKESGDKTDWKKGEYCLVFPAKRPDENGHIACENYRAQVIDDFDGSTFTVFLID
ncbi:hypothetical protein pipiens_007199 [Culex pipiens pipiens]|uniref:Uncharacterized protein n=1 Tax=Culex pipiens pipiens TaxID=38569 RepID=A0ABD1DLU1_CULPP